MGLHLPTQRTGHAAYRGVQGEHGVPARNEQPIMHSQRFSQKPFYIGLRSLVYTVEGFSQVTIESPILISASQHRSRSADLKCRKK